MADKYQKINRLGFGVIDPTNTVAMEMANRTRKENDKIIYDKLIIIAEKYKDADIDLRNDVFDKLPWGLTREEVNNVIDKMDNQKNPGDGGTIC